MIEGNPLNVSSSRLLTQHCSTLKQAVLAVLHNCALLDSVSCAVFLLSFIHSFIHLLILAALGGNLGGVTSALLGLDNGQTAKKLQLDALFPVNAQPTPYKRCIDGAYGYGEICIK